MSKLDKQNRLQIPKGLLDLSRTDYTSEVRLYLNGDDFFLDNHLPQNLEKYCLGIITLDSKNRIYLSKRTQQTLKIKPGDNFYFFLYNDVITFKKGI